MRHAEIAGAGFAGLAAASALARQGWSVRVHEMADAPRSFGSGLYVHPFAQDVLRQIGAWDAVDAAAFAPATRTITVDGVARSVTQAAGQFRITTRAVMHRAVLDAALAAGVRIATRSQAVGAEPGGALLLADGARLEADLVVAADGVRSAIARQLGMALHRVQHPNGITRVLLDRAALPGAGFDQIGDFYDYRIRPLRVLYSPCSAREFYFCLMAPCTDTQATRVPVDAGLWASAFPALAPGLRHIGDGGRHDRYTTSSMPHWSVGRVAVIGDAAHAMPSSLGQGAGVSMLNAVGMAGMVAASADVASGLAEWERALRPVVERWQREAEAVARQRSLGEAMHPGEDFPAERPGGLPPATTQVEARA